MVKKSFFSITWGSLPFDSWLRIVFVDPTECVTMNIPMNSGGKGGQYVSYRAYWVNKYIPKGKIFDMVFPLRLFKRVLLSVPPKLRQGDKQIEFEFRKVKKEQGYGSSLEIRNWRLL